MHRSFVYQVKIGLKLFLCVCEYPWKVHMPLGIDR